MAKRKSIGPIPEFPLSISRDYFGAYLSGLTDGEACFSLALTRGRSSLPNPLAAYRMRLRADDKPILSMIQSFWGCGHLYHTRSLKGPGRPQWEFAVQAIGDLAKIVVPHFDHYPLFAKKKRGFLIWKEAVLFMYQAIERQKSPIIDVRARRTWTPEFLDKFTNFMILLKQQREFVHD